MKIRWYPKSKHANVYRENTISFKYPALLSSDHLVVHRLISLKHQELLHARVTILMTFIREDY